MFYKGVAYRATKVDVKFLEAIDGDSDEDGSVQLLDLDTLGQNFGLAGDWTDGDFTGDGQVQLLDLDLLG